MLGSGDGARSRFDLDVATRDAEQNNTETGSQNRTRAEQENQTRPSARQDTDRKGTGNKGQENQTGAARKDRAEAGHQFHRLHFGRVRFLGRRAFFVARFWGRRPLPRVF